MNSAMEGIITIAGAIIGVATLAVLVSKNANTASVIQAGASAFGNSLAVAVSPISGATVQPNLTYPSSAGMGLSDFSAISNGWLQ